MERTELAEPCLAQGAVRWCQGVFRQMQAGAPAVDGRRRRQPKLLSLCLKLLVTALPICCQKSLASGAAVSTLAWEHSKRFKFGASVVIAHVPTVSVYWSRYDVNLMFSDCHPLHATSQLFSRRTVTSRLFATVIFLVLENTQCLDRQPSPTHTNKKDNGK